jgi:hypothetical protein
MKIISKILDQNTSEHMEGSDNEETKELQFDLDDYKAEVPNHDHALIQEKEEAWENEDLTQANIPHSPEPNTKTRSSRIKNKSTILTFEFNSQDRRWADVQHAFKAEVITPILCESNPQDAQYLCAYFSPTRSVMEMLRTKYDMKRKGLMKALRKELKTIIDNATLDLNTQPEDG